MTGKKYLTLKQSAVFFSADRDEVMAKTCLAGAKRAKVTLKNDLRKLKYFVGKNQEKQFYVH